jgi:5-methylcytosine-specific restriction endonuclease McrA
MHMSEDTACTRIRAARAARKFPAILPLIAEGRLNLTAVVLLGPYLTHENVNALLADATHKSKAEVQLLLAHRFPKPDAPTIMRPLTPDTATISAAPQVVANIAPQLVPEPVVPTDSNEIENSMGPLSASAEPPARLSPAASYTACASEPHTKVTPCSPGRFVWQLTADPQMQDLLDEAKDLLGRDVPGGDLRAVLKRGLEVLVEQLRKSRFAATSRPRPQQGPANGRHVPAEIVRAVTERDGRQCTFASADGRRCSERSDLELDHRIPFARGGETTVENLRLLCSEHNQHEAERVFGQDHMREQIQSSRAKAAQARAATAEGRVRANAMGVPQARPAAIHHAAGRVNGAP